MAELHCWKCGTALNQRLLPLTQRAECPDCHAALHVCRMCRHYAPGKTRHCLEPVAETVKDTRRANYCDWFQPGSTGKPAEPHTDSSRAALDRLFGAGDAGSGTPAGSPRAALDSLFGPSASKD